MIMLVRVGVIALTQLIISLLVASPAAAYPWWPFQMIAANAVCIPLLFVLSRREGRVPASLFLRPFAEGAIPPGLKRLLRDRPELEPARRLLLDAALAMGVVALFGVPAFLLSRGIDSLLQAGAAVVRYAALPQWATLSMTVLLPPSMALGEIPWYLGFFFPRFEQRLGAAGVRHPSVKAALLCCGAFALQHCFQPFVPDATWLGLRFLVELPLILLSAAVIRLMPRFTPVALLLHLSLAVEVVLRYTSLVR